MRVLIISLIVIALFPLIRFLLQWVFGQFKDRLFIVPRIYFNRRARSEAKHGQYVKAELSQDANASQNVVFFDSFE